VLAIIFSGLAVFRFCPAWQRSTQYDLVRRAAGCSFLGFGFGIAAMALYADFEKQYANNNTVSYGACFGLHIAGWVLVMLGWAQLRRILSLFFPNGAAGGGGGVGGNAAASAQPNNYNSSAAPSAASAFSAVPRTNSNIQPTTAYVAQQPQPQYYAAPAGGSPPTEAPPPYEEQQEGQPASAPPMS